MAEDIKKILQDHTEETKRHFDIAMGRVRNTLDHIILKQKLNNKVDRDEFAALERRVSLLEAKSSQ